MISEMEIGGARFLSLTLGAHVSWDSFGWILVWKMMKTGDVCNMNHYGAETEESFHSLRKSELSPLLASQIEYFLTRNEKALHLSRKHILFTAHVGLLLHSIQTQFHHVKLIMPKQNHWNSQAMALLSLLPHKTLHLFLRAFSEWQDHRTHLWERQIKG